MAYHVVFDVAQRGYRDWIFAAFGLIVLLGIGASWVRSRPGGKATTYAGSGFVILWIVLAVAGTYHNYAFARDALLEGRAQMYEGMVTHYVPQGFFDPKDETFTVAGNKFTYSTFFINGCFNNSFGERVRLREGTQVRLWAVEDTRMHPYTTLCIVKIEIADTHDQD